VNEVAAIQLLQDKLSVRLPRILAVVPYTPSSSEVILVMDKVPGTSLADALASFNDHQVARTTNDLLRLVAELHAFDAQSSTFRPVAGVDEIRWIGTLMKWKETPDMRSYEEFIIEGAQGGPKLATPGKRAGLEEWIKRSNGQPFDYSRPPVFSHGDLVPENILVDSVTGQIIGLIDFEFAGWHPYFYDKTRALILRGQGPDAYPWLENWKRIQSVVWPNDKGQAMRYLVIETTVWENYIQIFDN